MTHHIQYAHLRANNNLTTKLLEHDDEGHRTTMTKMTTMTHDELLENTFLKLKHLDLVVLTTMIMVIQG